METASQNVTVSDPIPSHDSPKMVSRSPIVLSPLDIFVLTNSTKQPSSKSPRRAAR